MGLPFAIQVNGLSWWSIVLSCNRHVMAPFNCFTKWDLLSYAEQLVMQQITMHLPLPVDWNRNGFVPCNWCSVVLKMNFNRQSWHYEKCLVGAGVKRWAAIVVKEPIAHSIIIFTCTGERRAVGQSGTAFHLGHWRICPSIFVAPQILPVESSVMSLDIDDGLLLSVGLVDRLNWPTMGKSWFTIPRATILS